MAEMTSDGILYYVSHRALMVLGRIGYAFANKESKDAILVSRYGFLRFRLDVMELILLIFRGRLVIIRK